MINKISNLFNKLCTAQSLLNAKELKTDLVEFSYHYSCCSECAKYRGRVFSVTGRDKRFPKLPNHILNNGSVHDGCRCSFYPFIYGISTPSHCSNKNLISYSNRPFVDDRTKEEILNYDNYVHEIKITIQKEKDKEYYKMLLKQYPDITPKNFSSYRRLRKLNNDKFKILCEKAKEINIDLYDL